MNYIEQMNEWLGKHPDATLEEAFESGYKQCTMNWLHGKASLMADCKLLMEQILE